MMKNFFIGLALLIIGAGICFTIITAVGYSKGYKLTFGPDNRGLTAPIVSPEFQQASTIPSGTATPKPVQTVVATAVPSASPEQTQTGMISGTLGYPAEGIPAMEVVAFKQSDKSVYYSVKTAVNAGSFVIPNVPAGTYVVVAYPSSGTLSGGWTKAVQCGLSVECKDHTLLPVDVAAGKTTSGVEVKDWYVEAGTFPAKP